MQKNCKDRIEDESATEALRESWYSNINKRQKLNLYQNNNQENPPPKKIPIMAVPLHRKRLSSQHWHCSSSSCCCGTGSIPGTGISTCHGCGPPPKKNP